ncbi:hypothetical protein PNEG_02321 [Pneumocystis murina B123]|uniref:Major surface glycoprotein 2 C-terminal domain-containing protein n=1 Tax=Pneumocystis murina (strain B123) TaxID=1069680 RepID=M7NQ34_PNEMU|nr:hypothetical protein PNEG_02321 [Pneumocystis murina B123]EMR09372.1 hypothetical protein PNEG_02321 [Pneumocystis murina B123]
MSSFLFLIFIFVLSVLSKNIDFVKDLNKLELDTRSDSYRAFWIDFNFEYDENIILYLILKKNVFDKNLCKKTLENRCSELLEVIPELKNVCDGELSKKCEELQSLKPIMNNCTEFEIQLTKISFLEKNYCNIYIERCILFENVCPNKISDKCNELREICYKKQHEEIADIALLRVFPNFSIELCESSIQEYCLKLSQESDQLVLRCLKWKSTCQQLMKVSQDINIYLKKEIKSIIKNVSERMYEKDVEDIDKLKKDCHQFLRDCNLYVSDFINYPQNIDKNNELSLLCFQLRKICENSGIIVIFYNLFNPIESDVSLSTKIDLNGLHKKAAESGIIVNKRMGDLRDYHLLALLIHSNIDIENKCKKIVKNNCSSIEYFHKDLEKMCLYYKDNNNDMLNCLVLKSKLRNLCKDLSTKLKKIFHSNNKDKGEFAIRDNYFLVNDEDCKSLLSLCFYIGECCEDQYLDKLMCRNLTSICYHKARLRSSYNFMRNVLRGNIYESSDTMEKSNCINKLINICRNSLHQYRGELLELCLSPKKTCSELIKDTRRKCSLLKKELDINSIQFSLERCDVLESSCEELSEDCITDIGLSCYVFQKYCEELRTRIELKNKLLQEKNNSLSKQLFCVERLNNFCTDMIKEANATFMGLCIQLENTCKAIAFSIMRHCTQFQKNFEKYGILFKIQNKTITFYDCKLWKPYCDMLKNNCQGSSFLQSCSLLNEVCEDYYRTEFIELSLMFELNGYLKEQEICMSDLSKRCNMWNQANNKTFQSLCNTLKNDQGLGLCKKLQVHLQKQCIFLDFNLRNFYVSLLAKEKLYKEKKKKATNSTKEVVGLSNSSLIRNFTEQNNYGIWLNKLYVIAFQDVADLLDTEIQVIKDCNRISSETIFKDDCVDIQDLYKKILEFCDSFRSYISNQSWLFTLPVFSTFTSTSIETSMLTNTDYSIKETITETLTSTESSFTVTHTEILPSTVTHTEILPSTVTHTEIIPSTVAYTESLSSTITYTQFIKGWSTLTEKLTETVTVTITLASLTTFIHKTYFPIESRKNFEASYYNFSYLFILFSFFIIIILCIFNFFLFLHKYFFVK